MSILYGRLHAQVLEELPMILVEFASHYACLAVQPSSRGHNFCYRVPNEGSEILLDSSWKELSSGVSFHHYAAKCWRMLLWHHHRVIMELCMFLAGLVF